MITAPLSYNLAILVVDLAVIAAILLCKRTAWSWWTSLLAGGVTVGVLALGFTGGLLSFYTASLVACALFLHGPVLLTICAWLLRRTARKTALLSVVTAVGIVGVGIHAFFIEPTWLEVTHHRIASPKIERPVRIVVLADFQTDAIGPYERRVLQTVMEQQPDVLLLAGDYLSIPGCKWNDQAQVMNNLLKELDFNGKEGAFAIGGNIDVWNPWFLLFQNTAVMPVPRTRTFDVAGIRLTCLAVNDSFRNGIRIPTPSSDRFHVVLGHAPNYAIETTEGDLLLAGHTHGGQVQIPGFGPIFTGCRVPRNWASGVTELSEGRKLIVSRGTGLERGPAPRLRFCCRPEIVVIDLVPEEGEPKMDP
ncbi:MAG: metallophosphoesterase [Pirellulales bacterium]|nr:metallophosphoesterase [Pirellulales bacterium]